MEAGTGKLISIFLENVLFYMYYTQSIRTLLFLDSISVAGIM
jgi:hypothetical protein